MPGVTNAQTLSPEEIIALNRLTIVARTFAGTAHDVNNALQIISGSAELLDGLADAAGPGRRAVERIQAQAARAATVIQEMTQFSRDRGDATGPVSLRDVATRAMALRAFPIRRAGLVLAFDAASAPAAAVTAASARLQQAVLNLIINAEQALQGVAGGAITVELEERAGEARLCVIDNGRGLDAAIADRAFEPFVSSHPAPDTSGLGLTAARLIARSHGGEVAFEPRVSGTSVVLTLPLKP